MLLALAFYFLIAVLLAALLLLPSLRETVLRWLLARANGFAEGFKSLSTRAHGSLAQTSGHSRARVAGIGAYIARHRIQVLTIGALILLPSVIAFSLRHNQSFYFEDTLPGPDARVQALLAGERLVPPPPLPPTAFTTREVELVRPNLGGASRDWNLLDADFRQRLLLVYKIMREQHGYEMVLIEGYRSPERQEQLAGMGSHVTNAGAFQSYHQYGLGADSAFLRDGKVVITEKDPWAMRGYQLYGETAETVGLTWGGRWKMMDFGHVELRRPGVMQRGRATP